MVVHQNVANDSIAAKEVAALRQLNGLQLLVSSKYKHAPFIRGYTRFRRFVVEQHDAFVRIGRCSQLPRQIEIRLLALLLLLLLCPLPPTQRWPRRLRASS